jgi:hypothetical protein
LHSRHELNELQNNITTSLSVEEKNRHHFTNLDYLITDMEIKDAAKKLKKNKSAFSDRIKNEMIKCSTNILLQGFVKLFNLILEVGYFPSQWCQGLITPIFKSGDLFDCNNYRGMSITSCLGKFFCLILKERLLIFLYENKIFHPSKIGFLPNHRTADHIFTLKSLIDKNVTQKTNGKIYACFVDFRKAFDSVWHDGLFLKLLKNKIGGKFFDLIKNLYSNSRCAVKQSQSRTYFFPYLKGVRQGFILGPLLFNIYLNYLPQLFNDSSFHPLLLPNETKLNCLLSADDLVLLSTSKKAFKNV